MSRRRADPMAEFILAEMRGAVGMMDAADSAGRTPPDVLDTDLFCDEESLDAYMSIEHLDEEEQAALLAGFWI